MKVSLRMTSRKEEVNFSLVTSAISKGFSTMTSLVASVLNGGLTMSMKASGRTAT